MTRGWPRMRVMRVDDRYRILAEDSHLPEEVPQGDADGFLARLQDSLDELRGVLAEAHGRGDILGDVVAELMGAACIEYDDGRAWHLDCLSEEVSRMRETLATCDDDIPSYEDSETVLDAGYRAEMYGDNGIYVKVLEDSDKQEVVEEVVIRGDEPAHRVRTTVWEAIPGGRHSKEIRYEDVPIDGRLARLIRNTQRMREARGR